MSVQKYGGTLRKEVELTLENPLSSTRRKGRIGGS